jgi:hypothetical protein
MRGLTFIRLSKAQSTLEYGIMIAVIVAGLIVMQTYIKRGLQGRLKGAGDELAGEEGLYEPDYYSSTSTDTATRTRRAQTGEGGIITATTSETATSTATETTAY